MPELLALDDEPEETEPVPGSGWSAGPLILIFVVGGIVGAGWFFIVGFKGRRS